jgi:uncharacterized protein YbcC (UPF0753/DUF2309 family)
MSDILDLRDVAERACSRIAPTWPLDRFIAVNPFWPLVGKPLPEIAGELVALSGARLLMPRKWYANEWRAGHFKSEHVREALAELGSDVTEDELVALFWSGEPTPARRPLVVDTLEALLRRENELTWRDFIIDRVSRFCAAYFDDGQAQISAVREGGFYASWRAQVRSDQAPQLFMGLEGFRAAVAKLPDTADEMISLGLTTLAIPAEERERYLWALLVDVNGWSSWCAYLRWSARIAGELDSHIRELLAIRLGWEWILFTASDDTIRAEWRIAMTSWPAISRAARSVRSDDWILQRAMEIAWESPLRPKLIAGFGATRPASPKMQVGFCLDVRSERFRRALEAQGSIQTIGLAGFFGVPIEYLPLSADDARPQLPGLLAPKYRVTDTNVPPDLEAKRHARLDAANAWKAFKSSSLSSFAFVDSVGLFFAGSMFRDMFRGEKHRGRAHEQAGLTDAENDARMPRLTTRVDGTNIPIEERCEIAAGLLRAMGLTKGFARLVLLLGHGSETRNNAHAAGYDCGACGGQSGDVNARAAAALLNDVDVRAGLATRGIAVPTTTLFVGGMHNTTTDDVSLWVENAAGAQSHAGDIGEARAALERAGIATRRERAPKLGLQNLDDTKLYAAMVKRATNWAEVRPEWGLVGNAAFVIAPRERTAHIDLEGRVFLQDYRFDEDKDNAVLEAIMTGPVVVAHWINFQYYMSTVDNARYGSGNKVLHNIVGGHLGVFEGNGGDLRIGLSLQSLHDGEKWMHTPLRLAVFIEAPRGAIDKVLEKHPGVRDLIDNEWIHMFQLDATDKGLVARRKSGWYR